MTEDEEIRIGKIESRLKDLESKSSPIVATPNTQDLVSKVKEVFKKVLAEL